MIEPLNKEKINAIKESNKKDLLLPFDCVYVLTLIDNQSRIYNFYEEMAKLGVADYPLWNCYRHIDGAYQTTMNLWFPYINYESTIQV